MILCTRTIFVLNIRPSTSLTRCASLHSHVSTRTAVRSRATASESALVRASALHGRLETYNDILELASFIDGYDVTCLNFFEVARAAFFSKY